MNILKIAKAHKKDLMANPVATLTVSEWVDPDTSTPVTLRIMRPSAADVAEIAATRKTAGPAGVMMMAIIRCCYRSDDTNKRAFADTDLRDLMENVDQSVLKGIYSAISNAMPELGLS